MHPKDPFPEHWHVSSASMDNPNFIDKTEKKPGDEYELKSPDDIDFTDVDPETANLITSLPARFMASCRDQYDKKSADYMSKYSFADFIRNKQMTQLPVIDIDVPCELVPSSRKGHYHLFIHKEIPAQHYLYILSALANAKLVEDGYLKSYRSRGFTAVRTLKTKKPGVPQTAENMLKEIAELRHENALLRRRLEQNEAPVEAINELMTVIEEFEKKLKEIDEHEAKVIELQTVFTGEEDF